MEIIKIGNPIERFKMTCKWCGCVFIAEKSDFSAIWGISEVKCPHCKLPVRVERKRVEKDYQEGMPEKFSEIEPVDGCKD